jgi:hypothetical protein
MNAEEQEIYTFLTSFADKFVSVMDISKLAGSRNRFALDKNWALPVLRRMELDGVVECNDVGEYRAKGGDTTTFRQALERPTPVDLGETTIIMLSSRNKS